MRSEQGNPDDVRAQLRAVRRRLDAATEQVLRGEILPGEAHAVAAREGRALKALERQLKAGSGHESE